MKKELEQISGNGSSPGSLFTRFAALAAVILLAAGTVVVLRPFFAAGMFAAVFVMATWPLYARMRHNLRGRNTLAASIATVLVILLLVLPFLWLMETVVARVPQWFAVARSWVVDGLPPPPAWVKTLPVVGTLLDGYFQQLASDPGALRDLAQRLFEAGREPLVAAGGLVAGGAVQLITATFIAFFFYRDGELLVARIRRSLLRLAGPLTNDILHITQATVRGVVLGIVGTAFAQGAIATLGFAIAGVPAPLLLGGLTALLSIIPGGPVLVWLGATIWLLTQQQAGWAIFMAVWGMGLISTIDNVLRPMLISHGTTLSFVLGFLGVLGGVAAFGFVGVFIGPTLLALSLRLWESWAGQAAASPQLIVEKNAR